MEKKKKNLNLCCEVAMEFVDPTRSSEIHLGFAVGWGFSENACEF